MIYIVFIVLLHKKEVMHDNNVLGELMNAKDYVTSTNYQSLRRNIPTLTPFLTR